MEEHRICDAVHKRRRVRCWCRGVLPMVRVTPTVAIRCAPTRYPATAARASMAPNLFAWLRPRIHDAEPNSSRVGNRNNLAMTKNYCEL